MQGTRLKSHVQVDLAQFRPIFTTVPFWVEAPELLVRLTLPRWNTHSVNVSARRSDVGRMEECRFDGFYRYFTEARKNNIDQLKIDIKVCIGGRCIHILYLCFSASGSKCRAKKSWMGCSPFNDFARELLWLVHSVLYSL
jgi:hypothetical protein